MRESDVEKYFVKRCKGLGGEVRKVRWLDRKGAPDRAVFFDYGFLFWVELKRPKKGAEEHQAREHKRLKKKGQRVFVLDTKAAVDVFIERVTKLLEAHVRQRL